MRIISGHYTDKFDKHQEYNAEIPGEWDELDAQQYATILQLLVYEKADRYTIISSILSVLFGPQNWHILNNLPDEQLHALTPLTNFVMETAPSATNKYPIVRIRGKNYYAPANDLSNIGFGEWCFAYQFYTYYIKSRDITFLNKLIATLYRPKDPNQNPGNPDFSGDVRLPFNENLIENVAKGVADTEERFRLAILGWLRAAFTQVQDTRKHVFPEPEVNEYGTAKESSDSDARTWLTVFRELLGPKWGTTKQLKFTNAMFVLDHLQEQQLEFAKSAKPTD